MALIADKNRKETCKLENEIINGQNPKGNTKLIQQSKDLEPFSQKKKGGEGSGGGGEKPHQRQGRGKMGV